MKKILLLFFALAFYSFSYGQSSISIGGVGAFNSDLFINQNAYGSIELPYQFKPGYAVGPKITYHFQAKSALTMEAIFASQGANYFEERDGFELDRSVKMNYVQIPIMYQFRPQKDRSGFLLEAGLQFGFLMGSDIKYNSTHPDFPGFVEADANDRFNGIDIGLAFGVGTAIDLSDALELQIMLHNYTGIMDINTEDYRINNFEGEYSPSFNSSMGIKLGLVFYIGDKIRWKSDDEMGSDGDMDSDEDK